MKGFFITGTDTGVGKTIVSLYLMRHLKKSGRQVACMKPVSAGCEMIGNGLRNDDALRLQAESTVELPYEWINPYAFEPPIAPHIAAEHAGVKIDKEFVKKNYDKIAAKSEFTIVEGAGGWLVPINDKESMADIAIALGLPVILVVGMRLGCLNHALLTANSIEQSGLEFAGWIANQIDPGMLNQEDNMQSLKQRISTPLLGNLEHSDSVDSSDVRFSEHGKNLLENILL